MHSLREAGLSLRAIAAATGMSKTAVHDDLAAGGQNRPPGPEPTQENDDDMDVIDTEVSL